MKKNEPAVPASGSTKALVTLFVAASLTAAAGCSQGPPAMGSTQKVVQTPSPVTSGNTGPTAAAPPPASKAGDDAQTVPRADYCEDQNKDGECDDGGGRIDSSGGIAYFGGTGIPYYRRASITAAPPRPAESGKPVSPSAAPPSSGSTGPAAPAADAGPSTSARSGSFTPKGSQPAVTDSAKPVNPSAAAPSSSGSSGPAAPAADAAPSTSARSGSFTPNGASTGSGGASSASSGVSAPSSSSSSSLQSSSSGSSSSGSGLSSGSRGGVGSSSSGSSGG